MHQTLTRCRYNLRRVALGLSLLLGATAAAPAATPLRGLACVRSASAATLRTLPADLASSTDLVETVFVLYPLVIGPDHSIRALSARFKPLRLRLQPSADYRRVFDTACLVGVDAVGRLTRIDSSPASRQAGRRAEPRAQIVAANIGQ